MRVSILEAYLNSLIGESLVQRYCEILPAMATIPAAAILSGPRAGALPMVVKAYSYSSQKQFLGGKQFLGEFSFVTHHLAIAVEATLTLLPEAQRCEVVIGDEETIVEL
jgi:hypothetical protein